MAASTLDDAYIILKDNVPGPILNQGAPVDGFTGGDHHNQAYEKFKVGTKYMVWDDTNHGWSIFAYLQYGVASSVTTAAKAVCWVDATATAKWYQVCNDPDNGIPSYAAVALSAMTADYYGWFWVGGVCPVSWVSGLDGNYITDGNVAAGAICVGDSSTTDVTGFLPVVDNDTVAAEIVCGWSLAADA